MAKRVDWRAPQQDGDPPLWEVANFLRERDGTWQDCADDVNSRYGLSVSKTTLRTAVQKALAAVDKGELEVVGADGGNGAPPRSPAATTPPPGGANDAPQAGEGNEDGYDLDDDDPFDDGGSPIRIGREPSHMTPGVFLPVRGGHLHELELNTPDGHIFVGTKRDEVFLHVGALVAEVLAGYRPEE